MDIYCAVSHQTKLSTPDLTSTITKFTDEENTEQHSLTQNSTICAHRQNIRAVGYKNNLSRMYTVDKKKWKLTRDAVYFVAAKK